MEPHFDPYHDIREEAPTLYALAGKHGFRVPAGYFDQLPEAIQAQLQADQADAPASPILDGLDREPGFQVPEGYFEALPDAIAARIGLEEGAEVSTDVPEGFFAQLEQDILAQTVHAEPAPAQQSRVIGLRPWMGWAAGVAAAALAAVFVFDQATPEECETFACLWEQTDTQDVLETLDEEELLFLLDGEASLTPEPEADQIEAYLGDDSSLDDLLDDADLDGLLEELNDDFLFDN